jgi:hypothetical protein
MDTIYTGIVRDILVMLVSILSGYVSQLLILLLFGVMTSPSMVFTTYRPRPGLQSRFFWDRPLLS